MKQRLVNFKDSFKFDITFLKILLYDMLFYAIVVPTLFLASYLMTSLMGGIDPNILTQEMIAAKSPAIQAVASQMESVLVVAVITSILTILITLAAWSLSRGLIYTKLLKKKLTKKLFFKFAGSTFVLAILITNLLLVTSIVSKIISPYLLYAVILIITYFLILNFVALVKTNKIFCSIGDALSIGTKKLPKLIIPCILILVVFAVLSALILLTPLKSTKLIPLVIFALFMTWARIYFVSELK
ncbi:MAG: hypothetical protein V3V78_05325 [Candidatus Woesearchaeota archaeon]